MHSLPEYFTVTDIAKHLKLNPITIYGYIKSKRLLAVKIGRYYRVSYPDLFSFLDSVRVK